MKNINLILVILIVIAGAGGFFGGMKYQQSKQPMRQFVRDGNGNGNVNRNNFRPVTGEITAADTNSITVKLTDGSSKIILFSEKTQINKASQVGKEELKTGVQVMVVGQTNSDGSVTAQNIQLNPEFRNRDIPR